MASSKRCAKGQRVSPMQPSAPREAPDQERPGAVEDVENTGRKPACWTPDPRQRARCCECSARPAGRSLGNHAGTDRGLPPAEPGVEAIPAGPLQPPSPVRNRHLADFSDRPGPTARRRRRHVWVGIALTRQLTFRRLVAAQDQSGIRRIRAECCPDPERTVRLGRPDRGGGPT